jgi:hypothetical protein
MSVSWDDLVIPLVRCIPEAAFRGTGLRLKDLGTPFPGGTNVSRYMIVPVFNNLLRGNYLDVLSGFDVRGESFIGWMKKWPHNAEDAARLWLAAPVRDPKQPRVFTSHDYDHWMRTTFTLKSVLFEFTNNTWPTNMAAAVKAGVCLGTPDTPEWFAGFVQPFGVEDIFGGNMKVIKTPEFLRKVLEVVLTAPIHRLHWEFVDFKTFKPQDRHVWAVPTMIWFQKQLEIKQAIAAAAQDTEATAAAGAGAAVATPAPAGSSVVTAAPAGSSVKKSVVAKADAEAAKSARVPADVHATIKTKIQGLVNIAPNLRAVMEDPDMKPDSAKKLAAALTTLERVFSTVVEGWHRPTSLPEAQTKQAVTNAMHSLLDVLRFKPF